jgi:AcrR family transcriptional regulator
MTTLGRERLEVNERWPTIVGMSRPFAPQEPSAPPQPSARRSDRTRAAILAAARERFAADGYERATIRAIAADAGIDPSMVMRYYGSKEKLFAAAADFALDIPDLAGVRPDGLGQALVSHFISRWERDDTLVALLRVAVTNPAAADRMRTIFTEQIRPLVAAVDADPARAGVRAGLLAAQMLGFALCRYVLALPRVAALPAEDAVEWLAPSVQHFLTGAPASGR